MIDHKWQTQYLSIFKSLLYLKTFFSVVRDRWITDRSYIYNGCDLNHASTFKQCTEMHSFFYLIKLNILNHFIKKCNFILISQSYFKTVDSYLYMLWIIFFFCCLGWGFFVCFVFISLNCLLFVFIIIQK